MVVVGGVRGGVDGRRGVVELQGCRLAEKSAARKRTLCIQSHPIAPRLVLDSPQKAGKKGALGEGVGVGGGGADRHHLLSHRHCQANLRPNGSRDAVKPCDLLIAPPPPHLPPPLSLSFLVLAGALMEQ